MRCCSGSNIATTRPFPPRARASIQESSGAERARAARHREVTDLPRHEGRVVEDGRDEGLLVVDEPRDVERRAGPASEPQERIDRVGAVP